MVARSAGSAQAVGRFGNHEMSRRAAGQCAVIKGNFAMSAPTQTQARLNTQPRPEYLCTAAVYEQCPHMPR